MSTAAAYIDGYNLYYGLKHKYGRRYLWLDLEAVCESMLLPGQELAMVRYFTAPVRGAPDSLQRQQTYWNALGVHCRRLKIHRGRFQEQNPQCRSCGAKWRTYEEKETDVGLAVALVEDAANRAFDSAILVSGDGDLCPGLESVRRLHPGASIVAAFPPDRVSDKLKRIADADFVISRRKLAASLLPETLYSADGKPFTRPASWK